MYVFKLYLVFAASDHHSAFEGPLLTLCSPLDRALTEEQGPLLAALKETQL